MRRTSAIPVTAQQTTINPTAQRPVDRATMTVLTAGPVMRTQTDSQQMQSIQIYQRLMTQLQTAHTVMLVQIIYFPYRTANVTNAIPLADH